MKKIFLSICLFASAASYAQYQNNYLQLTQVGSLYGDARYTGLGGAMSAVGSNVSAIGNNPAALARFVSSEINFSLGLQFQSNDNSYKGTTLNNTTAKLGMQSYGFVGDVSPRNSDGGKYWLGFSGQRVYDFKNVNNYRAQNVDYTLNEFFADQANGTVDDNIVDFFPFSAGLAFNAYLINPDTVNFDTYSAEIQNENARIENNENGSRFENYLSFGINESNKWYLGASIGLHSASYENRYTYFGENVNAETQNAKNYTYNYYYNSSSFGINATLGVIYKPSKVVNLGLSYKSPTKWYINENFSADMSSEFSNVDYYIPSEFEGIGRYKATSPSIVTAAAAITDKQFGLFSVEIANVKYNKGKLTSYDQEEYIDFSNDNRSINNNLKSVWQLKVGYEKPFKQFALRAGFNTIPSAFENNNSFLSYNVTNISGGFGIFTNFGKIDFSVISSNSKRTLTPYDIQNTDIATTETRHLLFNFGITFLQL